jgi:hypothetical protein
MSRRRNKGRRIVAMTVLVAGLIGVVIVVAPNIATLIADRGSEPTQPRIDLDELATGSYVEIVLPTSHIFVLRDFDDQVHVFTVPFSDTAYWLPEFDWTHPAIPCAEFGPDNKDGKLIEDGKFRCRQPDHGEFFRYEHSWSYSGENLGYRTADLKEAKYELVGNTVLLKAWQ